MAFLSTYNKKVSTGAPKSFFFALPEFITWKLNICSKYLWRCPSTHAVSSAPAFFRETEKERRRKLRESSLSWHVLKSFDKHKAFFSSMLFGGEFLWLLQDPFSKALQCPFRLYTLGEMNLLSPFFIWETEAVLSFSLFFYPTFYPSMKQCQMIIWVTDIQL